MKSRNYSRKREAILAKICSTNNHPTADWVYQELKPEHPDLSLATVYRNIALFKEEGDVVSVGTVNGQERFDGNTHPHGHFVCQHCQTVIDIDTQTNQPEITAYLEDTRRYQVERVYITAYGRCETCSGVA
jgi:Fur family peroxide stress response transcriptional regulator